MKTTRILVETGGSGTGIGYYSSVLQCARQRDLDKQAFNVGRPTSSHSLPPYRGSCMHGLLAFFYRDGEKAKTIDTDLLELVESDGSMCCPDPAYASMKCKAVEQAKLCFRKYRTRYDPNEFGEVLDTERRYNAGKLKVPWKPNGMALTAQIDLEVKLETPMNDSRGVRLDPGHYIIDHKTVSTTSIAPMAIVNYELSLQRIAYALIWEAMHPDKELKGFIFNLITIPDGKRKLLWTPPPSKGDEKILKNFLQRAQEAQMKDPPEANALNCCSYMKLCIHYSNGLCPRY